VIREKWKTLSKNPRPSIKNRNFQEEKGTPFSNKRRIKANGI
jgi:hypothetical protein